MIDLNNPAHPGHQNQLITTHGLTASRIWYHPEPMLESVKNELLQECQGHRKERCGLIDSEWGVWKLPNTHEHPCRNYFISDTDAAVVLNQIYNVQENHVIGIWHTHPNNAPWPSPRDIAGWPNVHLNWRYFIITNDEVIEWELRYL